MEASESTDKREAVRREIKTFFRQVNVLFWAFWLGVVIFLLTALIVVYYRGPVEPMYHTFLLIAAPIGSIAMLILGFRMYMGRVEPGRKADKLYQKMESYRSGVILRLITLDGAAFFNVIAYVMTADRVFLAVCLLMMTFFIVNKPSLEKFIRDMQLNDTESRVMRDHAL